MNKQIFLNPQGVWDSTTQYKIQFLPSAIQVGLNLISCPMVIHRGTTFYATGTVQPTVGVRPAAEPAIWQVMTPGTVINSSPPTVNNDNTQGFVVGATWIDTSKGNLFICTNNATGAAVWLAYAGNA